MISKARVLIIEGDEWVARSLATFLRERHYFVHLEHTAEKGVERAREMKPDCIVCNVHLPDKKGFWVARHIRSEEGDVGKTPFVFLTEADDTESRLMGFRVGADMYLERPFTHEEVVAQIEALIEMAERLRDAGFVQPPSEPSSRAIGIILRGDIARMSVPTILMMLEMERRTGELLVESDDGQIAILFLAMGACVGARFQNARADSLEVLRRVIEWKTGKFTFMVTDHANPANLDPPLALGPLLLHASHLNDEEANAKAQGLSSATANELTPSELTPNELTPKD